MNDLKDLYYDLLTRNEWNAAWWEYKPVMFEFMEPESWPDDRVRPLRNGRYIGLNEGCAPEVKL